MKIESSCLFVFILNSFLVVISIHSFNTYLFLKLERKAGTGSEDIQNKFYQGKHKVDFYLAFEFDTYNHTSS